MTKGMNLTLIIRMTVSRKLTSNENGRSLIFGSDYRERKSSLLPREFAMFKKILLNIAPGYAWLPKISSELLGLVMNQDLHLDSTWRF